MRECKESATEGLRRAEHGRPLAVPIEQADWKSYYIWRYIATMRNVLLSLECLAAKEEKVSEMRFGTEL